MWCSKGDSVIAVVLDNIKYKSSISGLKLFFYLYMSGNIDENYKTASNYKTIVHSNSDIFMKYRIIIMG